MSPQATRPTVVAGAALVLAVLLLLEPGGTGAKLALLSPPLAVPAAAGAGAGAGAASAAGAAPPSTAQLLYEP
jgi:hypothetical protein